MAYTLFTLVCLVIIACAQAAAPKLPNKWTTCHQSQPDYSECLGNAIGEAVSQMANGERSLGIVPLDPLRISELHIGQGTGPVAIELDFSDFDFKGMSTLKLKNAKYDDAASTLTGDMAIDQIVIDGQYKIAGKVLVLPIKGSGHCKLVLDKVTGKVFLHGKPREENGKKYMDIEKFDFVFDPKNMKIDFENLFDGNKELGDNMNKFLNDNYAVVLGELKPAIAEAFGLAFKEISNRIFSRIPVDDILPK